MMCGWGTRAIVCVWLEDHFVEMVLSCHLSVGSEELDSDCQTHMVSTAPHRASLQPQCVV